VIDPRVRVRQPSSPSKQAQPLATLGISAQTGISNAVSEDEVRIHAYQLYERRLSEHRGGSEDRSVEDWLTAEAHLNARKNRANKTTAK
jgi:hypothetical protein